MPRKKHAMWGELRSEEGGTIYVFTSAVVLSTPAMVLSASAVVLSASAVVLSAPAVVLSASAVVLSTFAVVLSAFAVVLSTPAVVLDIYTHGDKSIYLVAQTHFKVSQHAASRGSSCGLYQN